MWNYTFKIQMNSTIMIVKIVKRIKVVKQYSKTQIGIKTESNFPLVAEVSSSKLREY